MKPAIASVMARSSSIIGEIAGMFALATTVMFDVLELLPAFPSGLVVETTAVFASGPDAKGSVTVSAIEAEPALAIEPSVQVTVVVPLQLPCVGVAAIRSGDVPRLRDVCPISVSFPGPPSKMVGMPVWPSVKTSSLLPS